MNGSKCHTKLEMVFAIFSDSPMSKIRKCLGYSYSIIQQQCPKCKENNDENSHIREVYKSVGHDMNGRRICSKIIQFWVLIEDSTGVAEWSEWQIQNCLNKS